jgi:hypothetical protein
VAVLVEEANDHRRLLHGLNDSVEQHTIETRVLKADALLVVLDERVHGGPLIDRCWTISHRRWPAVTRGCSSSAQGFQGAEPLA